MLSSEVKVEKIYIDEARLFLTNNGHISVVSELESISGARFIAAKVFNEILTVAVYGVPENRILCWKFQTQLYGVFHCSIGGSNQSYREKIEDKILAHIKEKTNVKDLFIELKDTSSNLISLCLRNDFTKRAIVDVDRDFQTNVAYWLNPRFKFYIYKISATNSRKYYIGRRQIKGSKVSIESCLNDVYMGSGGPIFQEWKSRHKENLTKKILAICDSWEEALIAEKEFIGDLYKTDPNCLNVQSGGTSRAHAFPVFTMGECSVHGSTKTNRGRCLKCSIRKSFSEKNCLVHGNVIFRGNLCTKCINNRLVKLGYCTLHGEVKFKGKSCVKCSKPKVEFSDCVKHGWVKHQGGICATCTSRKSLSIKTCIKHGETKHQGDVCGKCNASKSVSMKNCKTHGLVKHQKDVCYSCRNAKIRNKNKP